ncbi:hypothetical protein PFISCL1PPCAC_7361 [Pristionchus fissidentatus]|uniref:Phosphodiesterase n=1 Tax=Pristionchus fissidentatus TaxID=1538716 RepID=A0AAV5VC91_9BILA|nr:hypothetical protein PFISCL1PPCAC_7361 [Pristionchus fissidentatus]
MEHHKQSSMKGSSLRCSPSGRRVRISDDTVIPHATPSPQPRSDRPVFHLGDGRRSLTASDAEENEVTRLNSLMEAKTRREMHEKLKNRRTSLPASAFSMSLNKGSSKSLSSSNIAEARGIIADMLAERDIPSQVVSGLRAVSSLLQPPPTHSWTSHDFGLPDVVEDPLSGDQLQVQNNSKKADYFVFTTVTSATGLPAWEPGPSKARSNSSYWKPEDTGASTTTPSKEEGKSESTREADRTEEKEEPKIAPSPSCSVPAPSSNHVAEKHHKVIQEPKITTTTTEDSEVSSTSSSWAIVNGETHVRDTPPLSEYSFDPEAVVLLRDGCEMRIRDLEHDKYLARISDWSLPIFDMSHRNPQTVLSRMSYGIFKSMDLFRTFKIDMSKFFSFFHALEAGYHEIPYHNRIHAADVLHAVYYLIVHPVQPFHFLDADDESSDGGVPVKAPTVQSSLPASILQKVRSGMSGGGGVPCGAAGAAGVCRDKKDAKHTILDEEVTKAPLHTSMTTLELLALFTAAAMHDYDHPGRTNAFLVATIDKKAILYNDRSVLENHHAAESWKLLQQPKNNFIENLDAAETRRFRYLVLEYILATDLKQHFEIIMNFTDKMSELRLTNEPDRVMVSRMLIKLADVNSPAKPFGLHRQWTERICNEFYLQGDDEKALGMKVTAYMDRNCPEVAKLQHSFISHLVAPLIDTMNTASLLPILPGLEEPEIMINLKHNLEKWTVKLIEEGGLVEDVKEDEDDRISEEDTGVDVSSVRASETESPTDMPSLNANSREEEYI